MSAARKARNVRFDIPVRLTDGRRLWTLQEARQYVAGLPAAERASPLWQNAIHELDLCEQHATVWKLIAPVAINHAVHGITPHTRPDTDNLRGLSKRARAAATYKLNRAAYLARKQQETR